MYECKLHGGHFFVHSPQVRSFSCQRCLELFPNYNPPMPRTKTARQWYGELATVNADRVKAPWRCIIEACAFTVCDPCSNIAQHELARLKESKKMAESEGLEFDFEGELEKIEAEGKVGVLSKKEMEMADQEKQREIQRKGRREPIPIAIEVDCGDDGKIEVDSRLEVDSGLDDDDDEKYGMELLRRPYTRSAAAAAATARVKARRPTMARREQDRDGDAMRDQGGY